MADAKPVTTFRFDEATRAELDRIQEELGKNTWQQTINAIIMDYMRMVDSSIFADTKLFTNNVFLWKNWNSSKLTGSG